MKLGLSAAAVLLALGSNTAYSQQNAYSGNRMLKYCKAIATEEAVQLDTAMGRGVCLGTINTLFAVRNVMNYCLPSDISVQQAIRVAVRYMDANPQDLHKELTILAAEAFVRAWPCKQ